MPTVAVIAPQTQTNVSLSLGDYGSQFLDSSDSGSVVVTGFTSDGIPVATVTLTEQELERLCAERSTICRDGTTYFSHVQFDLRPGGGIIYVEVAAGSLSQRVGAVMQMRPDTLVFEVVGVDIGGSTYDPATLPAFIPSDMRERIQTAVADAERVGNELLQSISATTGGETYRLAAVSIDDEQMTLVMR
jgi:hypothetical protein